MSKSHDSKKENSSENKGQGKTKTINILDSVSESDLAKPLNLIDNESLQLGSGKELTLKILSEWIANRLDDRAEVETKPLVDLDKIPFPIEDEDKKNN